MLRSDFNPKAHTNFQNYFFVHNVLFQHIDVKSTSISRKIKVHIESISILVFYRRFKSLQSNKHKNKIILGV